MFPPDFPRVIDGPLAVVGDLHGAADLLERVLTRLRQTPDFESRWLVFVGDFLDRGPDSRRCIDVVLGLAETHGKVAAVMGNHDLAAIGALGLVPTPPASHWDQRYIADYEAWRTFVSYGVEKTEAEFNQLTDEIRAIKPYYDPYDDCFNGGVVPVELEALRGDVFRRLEVLLADLRKRMPDRHKLFLAGLPWCVEHPQYLIVHAGLTAEPYADQLEVLRRRDFTLGRPPWLHERKLARAELPEDCPLTVVSGHVVVPQVQFLQGGRRILCDTFGGRGKVLSSVLLPEMKVVTSDEG